MNAGLSNLINLKEQLLPGSVLAGGKYDTLIAAVGLGVADGFDLYTNRRLAYSAADTVTFTGDRYGFYLPRYPIHAVSAIETRGDAATGWESWGTSLTDLYNYNAETGWVDFGGVLGASSLMVRVTWSGGYWFDTSEEGTGTLTTGATALPASLLLAFYLQCKELWSKMDPLRVSMSSNPEEGIALSKLDLVPTVKRTLDGYRRMQLT